MDYQKTHRQTAESLTGGWFGPSFSVGVTAAAVAGLVHWSGICRLCQTKQPSPGRIWRTVELVGWGLTGGHDAFTGGDNLTVLSAGGDHGMICLRAVEVVDRQLRARHVGLQDQSMVTQTCQHHLKVDEELGLRVAPVQLQATRGHVGDVQRIFVCWRVIKNQWKKGSTLTATACISELMYSKSYHAFLWQLIGGFHDVSVVSCKRILI